MSGKQTGRAAGFCNSCQYWLIFTFVIKLTALPVCFPDIVLKSISSTLKLILLNYFNESLLSIGSVFVEKHETIFLLVSLESFISQAHTSRQLCLSRLFGDVISFSLLFECLCCLYAFIYLFVEKMCFFAFRTPFGSWYFVVLYDVPRCRFIFIYLVCHLLHFLKLRTHVCLFVLFLKILSQGFFKSCLSNLFHLCSGTQNRCV